MRGRRIDRQAAWIDGLVAAGAKAVIGGIDTAQRSRDAFVALTQAEQDAIIAFLEHL